MTSNLETLEEAVIKAPVQKEPAGKKPSFEKELRKPRPSKGSETFLFFLLFFVPAVTFGFVLFMARQIETQIGEALVWEHTGAQCAAIYRQIGQIFCLALLAPALVSMLKRKPHFARTSLTLAVLFMLLSFAFLFRSPRTYPVPPPVEPVIEEAAVSEVIPEPEPEPVSEPEPIAEPKVEVAPEPTPVVAPAPRHRRLILFPVFTQTHQALSILFPLHAQSKKESGEEIFWVFPYLQRTRPNGAQTVKTHSLFYPLYDRSEVYSEGVLTSSKQRFLFFRSEWKEGDNP